MSTYTSGTGTKPEQKVITQSNSQINLNAELVKAAGLHDFIRVKELVEKGANVNHVQRLNGGGWYSGDSHTALSDAVQNAFADQINYINVITYLLQHGADLKFKTMRGNWSRASMYSIIGRIPPQISRIKKEDEKIRFIKILIKHGLDINYVDSIHHEYRRGYSSYNESFSFKIIAMSGLSSKIRDICDRVSFDQFKLKKEIDERLKKEFDLKYPWVENYPQNVQQQNNNPWHQRQQENKNVEIEFIQSFIELGVDPNCSSSENSISGAGQNYGSWEVNKLFDYQNNIRQTILHRAIANNNVRIVKKLLQKGANLQAKLNITIRQALYPCDWVQQIKEYKIKENNESIQRLEQRQRDIQLKLKQNITTEDQMKNKRSLRAVKWEIFRAKRFSIENAIPIGIYKTVQLSCLDIAECLNVDQQLIQLLKQATIQQKKHQQPQGHQQQQSLSQEHSQLQFQEDNQPISKIV